MASAMDWLSVADLITTLQTLTQIIHRTLTQAAKQVGFSNRN